nr:reverse transcriptase domain-containing protein [Tanacetum cinerariifolium]
MADNRTMAQMLQAPIEGYEDAIVVPPINANNFELKRTLINLVQSNQFTGRQDPHNHLRFFNKVTSTFRHLEDAFDSAAGGNFLDKIPRECLLIIESKSKVKYSRNRVTDVRANANAIPLSSSHSNSFDLHDIPSTEQINKIEFINEGGIDSESEEIKDFLNDDSIQFGVEDSPFNMDKDILFSKVC